MELGWWGSVEAQKNANTMIVISCTLQHVGHPQRLQNYVGKYSGPCSSGRP